MFHARKTKFFVLGVGGFRYAIGQHQEHITWSIREARTRIAAAGDQSQRKLFHREPLRVPAARLMMQYWQMPGHRILRFCRTIEAYQREGGVHTRIFKR